MKLEIKHLAPYLPYKLEFSANSELYPKPTIQGVVRDIIYWNYHGVTGSYKMESIKPILRPLSDIVNHMSEIIPLIEIHSKNLEIEVEQISDMFPAIMSNYDIASKLFEFHYDVFGLIEKGLAINLNDIK